MPVLRRRHPGFDVIFKLERADLVDDSPAWEVGGALATPQDPDPALDRINVPAAATGATHHDAVDEASEDFASVIEGEA